jgi:hypothetical protein
MAARVAVTLKNYKIKEEFLQPKFCSVTKPFSIAPAALTYITLEFGGWAKSTQ